MSLKIISRNGLTAFSVRVMLGLIFVAAGFIKALDVRSFLFDVQQFDLLPLPSILPAAALVIACEICFGVALLVGFQTRMAASVLAMLLLLFVGVISFAAVHGKAIDCGCFGVVASDSLGLGTIVRDIFLIAGCLWLIAQHKTNVKDNGEKE